MMNPELQKQINEMDAKFRASFSKFPKEEIGKLINDYYSNLLDDYQGDKNTQDTLFLHYFELLNYYGQAYSSQKTFDNLIIEYNKPRIKQDLCTRERARAMLVISRTYLFYYQLLKSQSDDKIKLNRSFVKPLLEAKKRLTKLYTDSIDSKISLNEGQLVYCFENLGICYADLSRWYESLYYLNKGIILDSKNINLLSTKSLVLDRLRDTTCQGYSGQLLYQILLAIEEPKKFPYYPDVYKESIKELEKNINKEIEDSHLKISDLEKELEKVSNDEKSLKNYMKFISDNQLFLSEHSDYCKCRRGMKDNLKIRSTHEHTFIDYVKPFEVVLESIKYDFSEARFKFYNSLNETEVKGYYLRNLNSGEDFTTRIKESMLKDSLKMCLSIFDTIAIAILEALKVDYELINKNKFNGRNKVYFTNIFDDYISEDLHKKNIYLNPLFSICEDLKDTKAGHRDLKDLRNAIEHGVFVFEEHSKDGLPFNKKNCTVISKKVLEEKTRILLVLTKSLILTYTYFIRRESRNLV